MTQLIPEEEYRICVKNLPILTVDLLIFNGKKNRTLLFKRENDPLKGEYFSLGGRVNKGENIDKAIVRKIEEETGLVLKYQELKFGGFTDEIFANSIFEGLGEHCFNVFWIYLAEEKDLKLTLDNQHDGYRWFKVDDESLNPYIKKKIKMALRNL